MQHPIFETQPKIRAYLNRELTVQDLRDWFAYAKGPLLALPADLPAARLTGLIELALIEMGDGALGEQEFRSLLRGELDTATHFIVEGNPDLTFSGSATSMQTHVVDASPIHSSIAVLQETLADISA